MKLTTAKVTEEDCKVFDQYVKEWQDLLNLDNWRIERSAARLKSGMADVIFDDGAMLATYRVGVNFGAMVITPDMLERTALHELLHVVLRKFKMDQSEANEHEIVNMLEKLLISLKQEKAV
jgi:hypothetical protein